MTSLVVDGIRITVLAPCGIKKKKSEKRRERKLEKSGRSELSFMFFSCKHTDHGDTGGRRRDGGLQGWVGACWSGLRDAGAGCVLGGGSGLGASVFIS